MAERTMQQIEEHYLVEKELASRLRNSTAQQRRELYSEVYDELFRRVPNHPQLTQKQSPEMIDADVAEKMQLLGRFLFPGMTFLEIGPGDCTLSLRVASLVSRVVAVDVSTEITNSLDAPENFELILSDGRSIPVPAGSVDFAYSDQLMEHLHEDDAFDQLYNIFYALAPQGRYLCCTPNRLTGPHDISCFFDDEAQGFHLKEYTIGELRNLFRRVGFRRVKLYVGGRGHFFRFPCRMAILGEWVLQCLPKKLRDRLANAPLLRHVFGIRLMGIK